MRRAVPGGRRRFRPGGHPLRQPRRHGGGPCPAPGAPGRKRLRPPGTARRTPGDTDVIIGTKYGYSVRFNESVVRNMGRTATGVRGVNLRDGDQVVGASVITDQDEVLIITEKGYGKRTMASEYPTKGRGGKGIKTANITEKNGALAGLMTVEGNEDLMIITNTGVMIRTGVANISQTGRSTQGVKVMRLDQDAKIVTFTTVQADEKDEEIVEENE